MGAYTTTRAEQSLPDRSVPSSWLAGVSSCSLWSTCRLIDGEVRICQSNTIVRYIGRKANIYGSSDVDKAYVDEIMDGIVGLRAKYLDLIYLHQFVRFQSSLLALWSPVDWSNQEASICKLPESLVRQNSRRSAVCPYMGSGPLAHANKHANNKDGGWGSVPGR